MASMEWFTQRRIKYSQKYSTQKDLQSFWASFPAIVYLLLVNLLRSSAKFFPFLLYHTVGNSLLGRFQIIFLLAPTWPLMLNQGRGRTVISANVVMNCYHTTSQPAFSGQVKILQPLFIKLYSTSPLLRSVHTVGYGWPAPQEWENITGA